MAATAERLGYHGFFLPETWAFDVTVLLAEAALRTERIALGHRHPLRLEPERGYPGHGGGHLGRKSRGGRFVLGLGASTAQLTEGLHDVPFTAPLARLRQHHHAGASAASG